MGKQISAYLNREYFVDTQLPLGNLLFAGAARLFGYTGFYEFGKTVLCYTDAPVPYDQLRAFTALCGALTVIAVYAMLLEMKFTISIAALGALLVLFGKFLFISTHNINFH